MSFDLQTELTHYGVDGRGKDVRWFRGKLNPDLLDYGDLVDPYSIDDDDRLMPDGVAENQDRPLLFFVDGTRLAGQPDENSIKIERLRRTLAYRGDRAYLAIVQPGRLEVKPVSLRERHSGWVEFRAGTDDALTFFSRLALGRCSDVPAAPDSEYLFREMFKLVERSATSLESLGLAISDVISLVGRAIFFRFLADRGIVCDRDAPAIAADAKCIEDCFNSADNAAATCLWLDCTFNGNFLPLTDKGSKDFFVAQSKDTGGQIFSHLSAIVNAAEPTGEHDYQLLLKVTWSQIDFAHVPVGLLSQIYEKLSWKWDERNSAETSVHYTPRNIAATIIDEAFYALPESHLARILDPACGAGVFLVIAFRRLYRELWKQRGRRPGTKDIRRILEKQLVGFDISDSALKLTALSLYLTAIELDPDPAPPEKLKFNALREGKTAMLHDWRRAEDDPSGPVLGSLGPQVSDSFNHRFDLVVGNPPWTSISSKYAAIASEMDSRTQAIVRNRDPELGALYENPDRVPDLPFLWRSTVWCKPGGRIAMALPARTLFKQTEAAQKLRRILFQMIQVDGIINCSNLRKTKVWPEMSQPFMLLFARNAAPPTDHEVTLISPHTDTPVNSVGEMRIDSASAETVLVQQSVQEPWLWKTLALGTTLDAKVIRKIRSAGGKPLLTMWEEDLKLTASTGYQVADEQKKPQDASEMHGLPSLHSTDKFGPGLESKDLPKFALDGLFRTRLRNQKGCDPLSVYRGPLVVIRESCVEERSRGSAVLFLEDVVYNRSFYGYSAHGHPMGIAIAQYLYLFAHSKIWLYYALMTSGKLGFERPNVFKSDLDQFPILPPPVCKAETVLVSRLSDRLTRGDASVFDEIDHFFSRLYKLSKFDLQVINDTLEVRNPHDELGKRASAPPSSSEVDQFIRVCDESLAPFFQALGVSISISCDAREVATRPFGVIYLRSNSTKSYNHSDPSQQIFALANATGAVQVIQEGDGELRIGLLSQYRYWTPSRATLLCSEILRDNIHVFEQR